MTRIQLFRFKQLQLFRAIFAIGIAFGFCEAASPGTSFMVLAAAIVAGLLLGGNVLQGDLRGVLRSFVVVGCLIAITYGSLRIIDAATVSNDPSMAQSHFEISILHEHVDLLLIALVLSFISTILYWSFAATSLWETLIASIGAIYLLRGHRNYAVDAPKVIADFAWQLQIEPPLLLLLIAVGIGAIVLWYLYLSEHRPLLLRPQSAEDLGHSSLLRRTIVLASFALLAIASIYGIFSQYNDNLSRASSGVGQNSEEGESPLGFHSAVGKTKQPAALVRFATDLAKNPWGPMLYLREGALSQYNGRELVNSPSSFDSDVPRNIPGDSFRLQSQLPTDNRAPFEHAVYLLKAHSSIVAVDYPTIISPIKSPEDDRFLQSYKVSSLVLALSVSEMLDLEVAEPQWNDETKAHYLRAPGSTSGAINEVFQGNLSSDPVFDAQGEDLRYQQLSHKLTNGLESPVAKAIAISKYLSEKSIYTRTPGHTITESGDPVAPYLFSSDMRGYCVHFSHAAVYMMRLAGIPARIGTGYLTDLRYAKDGHILLHLGDRHAWPEIYVRNIGWVVVDVSPAQAENEQEIIPDEQLLEELMSKIDPIEEFLPDIPEQPEPVESVIEKITAQLANKSLWITLFSLIFCLFTVVKLWLRYGYAITKEREVRLLRQYRAAVITLSDLGLSRGFAQTRTEFSKQLQEENEISIHPLTSLFVEETYAIKSTATIADGDTALKNCLASIDASRGRVIRHLSLFNPRSILFQRR